MNQRKICQNESDRIVPTLLRRERKEKRLERAVQGERRQLYWERFYRQVQERTSQRIRSRKTDQVPMRPSREIWRQAERSFNIIGLDEIVQKLSGLGLG